MLKDIPCPHGILVERCGVARCKWIATLAERVEMIELAFYFIVLIICVGGLAMGMTSIARQLLD